LRKLCDKELCATTLVTTQHMKIHQKTYSITLNIVPQNLYSNHFNPK